MNIASFRDILPGDRVTIRSPQGQENTGRAVILNFPAGVVVLNMGGRHGRPATATASNFVKAVRRGNGSRGGFRI